VSGKKTRIGPLSEVVQKKHSVFPAKGKTFAVLGQSVPWMSAFFAD
jgi:hypothetical protein